MVNQRLRCPEFDVHRAVDYCHFIRHDVIGGYTATSLPLEGPAVKWVTRARPKTDRIACPWLIRRFIDRLSRDPVRPHRPGRRSSRTRPAPRGFDTAGATYDHRGNQCTFEVLIDDYDLGGDPALVRLARIVHAADIESEVDTDPFARVAALAFGGLDVEADDHRLLERRRRSSLRRPLRLVPAAGRGGCGMTEHLGYDGLRRTVKVSGKRADHGALPRTRGRGRGRGQAFSRRSVRG